MTEHGSKQKLVLGERDQRKLGRFFLSVLATHKMCTVCLLHSHQRLIFLSSIYNIFLPFSTAEVENDKKSRKKGLLLALNEFSHLQENFLMCKH